MILGTWGAVFGFTARLFGTHFMVDDSKEMLATINKTLDMKKIAHLAPEKTEADTAVWLLTWLFC